MKLGVIGAGGKMAGALLQGVRKSFPALSIGICEINEGRRMEIAESLNATAFGTATELVSWADFIILGVKPYQMDALMDEVSSVCDGKAFLSIALGYTSEKLSSGLPGARILRTMPSITATVGEGITLISDQHTLTKEEYAFALSLLSSVGRVIEGGENLVAELMPVTGSGPAYFFLIIEALADAAVMLGVPRDQAYEAAAQTAIGAGKMVLESGKTPAELKDAVCSPRGATIRAMKELESHGVRAAMFAAVEANYLRGKELE